jgi:putative intracellular protease/amidase
VNLQSKNILIVIPKSQFQEQELFHTLEVLKAAGPRILVLSKSGQEAVGMNKTRFAPDGVLVDWDKQEGFAGKYDAVLVMGGKGAPKSLWDDTILPQILTDHFRAERVIGAIGLGVAVLARASLLSYEAAGPEDEKFLLELEEAGLTRTNSPVVQDGKVITASGPEATTEFARTVVNALE